MDQEEGELINLDKYRRQRQRALEGNGLKERVLRGGAKIVLGGLGLGFMFMGVYGTIKFFSSEATPRAVQRDVSREYLPLPIERVFLPPDAELIEYLPSDGSKEGVRVEKGGYRMFYFDTNGDHTVDRIVIDDTTSVGVSHLEKKVYFIPVGSSNFIYGTELLKREREMYLNTTKE